MELLAPTHMTDSLAASMTWDPFCAQEGVQTLQSSTHFHYLLRVVGNLQLHLAESGLPYVLASDLLIRNIPLKDGVSPDVALWPSHLDLERKKYGSLELAPDLRPALILEIVSEHTSEADAVTKHEIYRLAGITEYWLYDPEVYAGTEPLCGWQLVDRTYRSIPGRASAEAGTEVLRYASEVLQTDWGLTADGVLQLWDPQQNDWYQMTPAGLRQIRAQAEWERAQAEQERTRAAQAETRAVQAETRAAQAETHAAQVAAENVRLRAMLQNLMDQD